MNEIELRNLLENVSDSYSDFVVGVLRVAKKYNSTDIIAEYILKNPNATTSEMIEFITINIMKIKPI